MKLININKLVFKLAPLILVLFFVTSCGVKGPIVNVTDAQITSR